MLVAVMYVFKKENLLFMVRNFCVGLIVFLGFGCLQPFAESFTPSYFDGGPITTCEAGYHWWNYTREGAFKKAVKIIKRIKKSNFVRKSFSTREEVETFIRTKFYKSDWPLILAEKALAKLKFKLSFTLNVLYELSLDEDFIFVSECKNFLDAATDVEKKLNFVFEVVINSPNYNLEKDWFRKSEITQDKLKIEKEKLDQKERHHQDDNLYKAVKILQAAKTETVERRPVVPETQSQTGATIVAQEFANSNSR